MPRLLLIAQREPSPEVITTLRRAGYDVQTAASSSQAVELIATRKVDIAIAGPRIGDMSGADILQTLRGSRTGASGSTVGAVASLIGVSDSPSNSASGGGRLVSPGQRPSERNDRGSPVHARRETNGVPEPHAAVRWARAVVPIVDCPKDPRTISGWSRWIAASPGAVRNWCFTAGIGPRHSLVFGRILRAVMLSDGGRRKPENLLDVVDRRTLMGLLRLAGLHGGQSFPREVGEFLERQTLVRDAEALLQVKRALEQREATTASVTAAAKSP